MDKTIVNLLKKIEKNGYKAYIVGGFVRDKLLGIESSDVDICTNALPKDIIKIFKLDKVTKDNYGCVNIKTKKYNIDITTFRKESEYENHIPKSTEYVMDLKTDLKRRDFTCNSLIMDYNEYIIDYYNGVKDINDKIIKCIGSVKNKLTEDPLRILRAIRLSIVYDFEIDDEIKKFIFDNRKLIDSISFYRKKEELDKIFSCSNKLKGLKLIKEFNLCTTFGLEYDKVIYCKDVLGIYAQIKFSEKYSLTKSEKDIITKVRDILNSGTISNISLYKYGLYINSIAGEILNIDYLKISKMYKTLPIKSRKDIKISLESIVKLNDNCYNGVNEIYSKLESSILSGKLKNKNRDIVKFIRK